MREGLNGLEQWSYSIDFIVDLSDGPQRLDEISQPHQVRLKIPLAFSTSKLRRFLLGSGFSPSLWGIIPCDEFEAPLSRQDARFIECVSLRPDLCFLGLEDALNADTVGVEVLEPQKFNK